MEDIVKFLETAHSLSDEDLRIAAQKFKFWVMGGNHYVGGFKECKDSNPLLFKNINCAVMVQIKKKYTPLIRKVFPFSLHVSFIHSATLAFLFLHCDCWLHLAGLPMAQLVQRELQGE